MLRDLHRWGASILSCACGPRSRGFGQELGCTHATTPRPLPPALHNRPTTCDRQHGLGYWIVNPALPVAVRPASVHVTVAVAWTS